MIELEAFFGTRTNIVWLGANKRIGSVCRLSAMSIRVRATFAELASETPRKGLFQPVSSPGDGQMGRLNTGRSAIKVWLHRYSAESPPPHFYLITPKQNSLIG